MTDERTADTGAIRKQELDEELADVLIAISVIAKRLAKKINEKKSMFKHYGLTGEEECICIKI